MISRDCPVTDLSFNIIVVREHFYDLDAVEFIETCFMA